MLSFKSGRTIKLRNRQYGPYVKATGTNKFTRRTAFQGRPSRSGRPWKAILLAAGSFSEAA